MENIENVDVDSFDMIERTEREEREQTEREDQDITDSNTMGFFDINIKPGHFSYDVLQQKFGIDELDLSIINKQIGGFQNFHNESLPGVIESSPELQEYTVRYAFESSGLLVEPELLKPLFEKLKFSVRESDGRLQAEFRDTKVKGKNFFIMDHNGEIEYFTKSGRTEYKNDAPQRYKMRIDYLKGYGIDKRIISNIEANDIYNKGQRLLRIKDAKEKEDAAKSLVDEIGESSTGVPDVDYTPETKRQYFTIKHVKEAITKMLPSEVETNIDEEGIGNVDNEEFLELSLEKLEETMPLKVRLKNIIKQHGITIASVTVMVGTIITSIATSLSNSSNTITTTTSPEIEKLKEETEKLREDEIKNKDKIEENDKKIKELEDKEGKGKSIWEYVKQVAKYILTGLSSLLSLIGKIVGIIGKALMSLGWIIYVVIAAVAALAYRYYEK